MKCLSLIVTVIFLVVMADSDDFEPVSNGILELYDILRGNMELANECYDDKRRCPQDGDFTAVIECCSKKGYGVGSGSTTVSWASSTVTLQIDSSNSTSQIVTPE